MTPKLVAALALVVAPVLAQPASALTITVQYSLAISNVNGGWSPTAAFNLSDDLSSPFSENLTSAGSATAVLNFYTATPAGSGHGNNDTTTITATFTNLNDGTSSTAGSYNDTAVWQADYNNQTDSITWSNSGSELDPIVVQFADGASLDITLGNASDWSIVPTIKFTLVDTPAHVPEPASLALFGMALAGPGCSRQRDVAGRRSRRGLCSRMLIGMYLPIGFLRSATCRPSAFIFNLIGRREDCLYPPLRASCRASASGDVDRCHVDFILALVRYGPAARL
jgi:hypothetical protein